MSFSVLVFLIGLTLTKGDFLFVDLNCGEICDSIEEVTRQQFQESQSLSHIGLVDVDEADQVFVVDAWPVGGVRRVSFSDFVLSLGLDRQDLSKSISVGVISPIYRREAESAVDQAKSFLGRAYDESFELGVTSFYCSELILFSWPRSFSKPWLKALPMYFGEPKSKERRVWEEYYAKRNLPLPQFEPGISPLGILVAAKEARIFDRVLPLSE